MFKVPLSSNQSTFTYSELCYCITGLSDVLPAACRQGRPPKSPQYMHTQSVKAASTPATVSHAPLTPITDGSQLSSKTGDQASKTIIKGNIVYKRTATGEVIASVIKNGPKPAVVGGVSLPAPAGRGRPTFESRTSTSLFAVGEQNMPADCPVNEHNVERVLDESITATQSMRRTLVSLKDDLRRMGGGPSMSATLKPIHLQHRINIAYKLACAFADYRSTIGAISSATPASSTATSSPAAVTRFQTIKSDDVPPAASVPPVTSIPPDTGVAPVGTGVAPVPVSVFKSVPATSVSQPSTAAVTTQSQQKESQQKTARSVAKTALKQTSADTMNVVSDDLWMSCDPDL